MAKTKQKLYLSSNGMTSIPGIDVFLNEYNLTDTAKNADIFAGWGRRPSMKTAQKLAQKHDKKTISLEDGFLRSVDFMPGEKNPPLSLILDNQGMYFDATKSSDLEDILNNKEFSKEEHERARNCIAQINAYALSKYNNGLNYSRKELNIPPNRSCVLIVDQCFGDASIKYGGAKPEDFNHMIDQAKEKNPHSLILIKTHPDVLAGRAKGYLQKHYDDENVLIVEKNVNPHCLFAYCDSVYCVTSLLGFEALMAGKQVHVFGQPFYAGWGACATEKKINRRKKKRSVLDIFHAAYIDYARYYDPVSNKQTSIEHIIDYLHHLKKIRFSQNTPYHCVGFRRWKRPHILPFITRTSMPITFHKREKNAIEAAQKDNGAIIVWASKATDDLQEKCKLYDIPLIRMEDGFIRSVGLGSDLIRGASLVLDKKGIYYNPEQESDLEDILNTYEFNEEELKHADKIQKTITKNRLSKYNHQKTPFDTKHWPKKKLKILVPGQVDNDASIKKGASGSAKSNFELLQRVREANPKAYIIYKPHPDVTAGNRIGKIPLNKAKQYADEVLVDVNIQELLIQVDEVHTMTSLVGFEALLLKKSVTCYGLPFYAGWGLTNDQQAINRRKREICLKKLIAGTLLCYPSYWDWENMIPSTVENVVHSISIEKNRVNYTAGTSQFMFIKRQGKRLWENICCTIRSLRL